MRLGIVESLGLLASLVFAIPVGIAGGGFLLDGRTAVGATLVVVALLMVIVPRRVVAPQDLPAELAERLVGRAVQDPGAASGEGPDATSEEGPDATSEEGPDAASGERADAPARRGTGATDRSERRAGDETRRDG